ncbi:MAG: MmcQ/YjbR family DNA-binding protein [Actinomycetota bacterium]
MSAPENFEFTATETLRQQALGLPNTVEGESCVNRAFSAGGKNFAFVGERKGRCTLRLKLGPSVAELSARAERDGERYQVGSAGWTLVTFAPDDPPPAEESATWIEESYRLLVPAKAQVPTNE